MGVLRDRDSRDAAAAPATPAGPCPYMARYPAVWEYLSVAHYPNGKPRILSTLTVFVDGLMVKLCLNDRDAALTAWVAGLTLSDALSALDTGLTEDTVEWRRSSPPKGRKS